jgi:predicted  nucleic acid-binding Zn-ribbon protein
MSGELEAEVKRYQQIIEESNSKHKRKVDEVKAQAERYEQEMRNGFEQEKDVLNLRIKSLEGKVEDLQQEKDDKQQELDETSKEYETAIDELEKQLNDEMNQASVCVCVCVCVFV